MSSAGNRGIISNNAGSSNWQFGRRGSGAAATDASTAERRRVSHICSLHIYQFIVSFPSTFSSPTLPTNTPVLDSYQSLHSKFCRSTIRSRQCLVRPTCPSCSLFPPLIPQKCIILANAFPQSSVSSAQKFANLHNQKRNSQDASAAARRASFAEMSKPPGFLGSMWQSWTKGTGK